MPREQVCFKKRKRYKYTLVKDYSTHIDIKSQVDIDTRFIGLTMTGGLTVKEGYAWDGPSGPTIDTKTFMRASLVHDALYQLMREEHLELEHRKYADELLREMCQQDGMCRFRACLVYKAVHLFGGNHATPGGDWICTP